MSSQLAFKSLYKTHLGDNSYELFKSIWISELMKPILEENTLSYFS